MAINLYVAILHTAVQTLLYARRPQSRKLQPERKELDNAFGREPENVLGTMLQT